MKFFTTSHTETYNVHEFKQSNVFSQLHKLSIYTLVGINLRNIKLFWFNIPMGYDFNHYYAMINTKCVLSLS